MAKLPIAGKPAVQTEAATIAAPVADTAIPADVPAVPEPVVEPALDPAEEVAPVVEEPESEVVTEAEPEAEKPFVPAPGFGEVIEELAAEPEVDSDIIENPTPEINVAEVLVAMARPDNGSCDLYDLNDKGQILVPALEVPGMIEHGFVVASEED